VEEVEDFSPNFIAEKKLNAFHMRKIAEIIAKTMTETKRVITAEGLT